MSGDERITRAAPFSIRFTADERRRVEAAAGGLPLGAYIKSVLFAEDAARYRARRKPPVIDQRVLAEVLARLGASRTANNLNQIAKAANQGALFVDDELRTDLMQACAEVAWMRISLMQALGMKVDDGGGS